MCLLCRGSENSNPTMERSGNASDAARSKQSWRFAENPKQWDKICMTKLSIALTAILAFGLASVDVLLAQQTPSAAPQAAPAKPATAATPGAAAQGSAAAKTGTATVAKRPATAISPLKTPNNKASYAVGLTFGKDIT